MAEQKQLGRWTMLSRIDDGASGTVWNVVDEQRREGVVKLSKRPDRNMSVEWEIAILERLGKKGKDTNIVRMLDHGQTANEDSELVTFMVMKKISGQVSELLNGPDRRQQALRLGMQLLKAIYDLHSEGVLHRDLKPQNMGLQPAEQPGKHVLTLYDLGLARMFTDDEGNLRVPRSWVGMRGTREWASGRAEQGREQNRIDDMWSWFYCLIEWFNCESNLPLAWTHRGKQHRTWLKSSYAPAKLLVRNCPPAFFTINSYLRLVRPEECPDYEYLANLIVQAMDQVQNEPQHNKPHTPRSTTT